MLQELSDEVRFCCVAFSLPPSHSELPMRRFKEKSKLDSKSVQSNSSVRRELQIDRHRIMQTQLARRCQIESNGLASLTFVLRVGHSKK